ncbi:hypothetical protein [Fibrobacter sp. UWS1]|uniref:hypothetical protein n=1 Tax=Fibrobacter sp. UWS1 TaxID=1896220 RepID=UPI000BB13C68|nr:hypothetical protein [Fibrobacter sp. UWS1]PBC66552.1 hypothetical protein BGX14_2176 [Fibrobacter sp. UWS1]
MPSNKKQMFVVIEKFAQCNEIEFSGDCEDQSILIGSDNTHSVQFQLQWSNDHYIVYLVLKKEKQKKKKITGKQKSQAIASLWNVSDVVQFLGAFYNLYWLYAKRDNPNENEL